MKELVYICSPLRGDVLENQQRARGFCKLALQAGYIPIAPHIYFTQFLDDENQKERAQGIEAGLELLKLLADSLPETDFFGDGCFRKNLESQRAGGFWYNGASIDAAVGEYCGQHAGVVFISDPQLKRETSRKTAAQILSLGGMAVMTGTLERGSYSDWLLKQMKMKLLRYPVHLNYAQYRRLVQENHFGKSIPYHSPAHFLNAM